MQIRKNEMLCSFKKKAHVYNPITSPNGCPTNIHTTSPLHRQHLTMADTTTLADATASLGESLSILYENFKDLGFLTLELKVTLTALAIIYAGSHASLGRPPSAESASKKQDADKSAGDKDVDKDKKHKDDDEDKLRTEGIGLSDAIMFPFIAGAVLMGLYYLIKYLDSPDIINKVMRWYMSIAGTFSLITFYSHGITGVISFVFPRYWRLRDGRVRAVMHGTRGLAICDTSGCRVPDTSAPDTPKEIPNPLPRPLAYLARSSRARVTAWRLRELLNRAWVFKLFVRGMGHESVQFRLAHLPSIAAALFTVVAYAYTNSPFLSNVVGCALSFASVVMLSPTNLLISSVILCGLFVYDIVMVFYTYVYTSDTSFYLWLILDANPAQALHGDGSHDSRRPHQAHLWNGPALEPPRPW